MPDFAPLRFLNGGRELFGLFLPAQPAAAQGHAVLLCNPFGQEAIRASRLYRVFGDRLQADGYDVLRFDYYGSGDSAGDDSEFDLDGAVADAVAAANLLMQRSAAPRLSAAGLRLGGNIATLASARLRAPLEHLVLFEPVVDGNAYIAALHHANATTLRQLFASRWKIDAALQAFHLSTPDEEAFGFATTQSLRTQLAQHVTLSAPWQGRARHVSILTPEPDRFRRWISPSGNPAPVERLSVDLSLSDIDWATNSALNNAIVPRPWIDHLLKQLSESAHV